MTKLLPAVLAVVLAAPFAAAEVGLPEIDALLAQQKAARAAQAAQAQAAAQRGACAVGANLEARSYELVFTPAGEKPMLLSFKFKSCEPYLAEESPHGRMTEDEAIRRFVDEKTGYELVVETSVGRSMGGGSAVTLVHGVRTVGYGFVSMQALGTRNGTLDFGPKSRLPGPADDGRELTGSAKLSVY